MTPQQLAAVAVLINEAAKAGHSVHALLQQADISDEQWDDIRNKIDRANERWESAGPGRPE